ncbi:MAG: hypothetical protein ABII82_15295 [Verrucomicrobiota bacterium]
MAAFSSFTVARPLLHFMRPIITLTALLLTADVVSAETYLEPQAFAHSLDLPPLQLSDAIVNMDLPLPEPKDNANAVHAASGIIPQTASLPLLMGRLPPIGNGSPSYPRSSLLPGGATTSPVGQALVTREVDLSGFSLE